MDISNTWFYTGSFSNGSDPEQKTANYNFDIDWGDGSKLEHFTNENAVNKFLPVKHTYAKAGVYRVTLTGQCDNLYGYDNNVNGGNKKSKAVSKWLWGVSVPKDSFSPLHYAYGSFFGCQGLKYVGYGVLHNIQNCKEVPHLYDGAILSRIEPWMLYGGVNIESIAYTFENCQMLEIDKDVFKNCSKVTNAEHCFHRCSSLEKIPQYLFHPMPEVKNVEKCFQSCPNLTDVPYDLFDNCHKITNFKQCFRGGGGGNGGDASYPSIMKIKTKLPPMWLRQFDDRYDIKKYEEYAHGCIHAANYQQAVINGWA